jgi:hypothetical protein
MLVGLGFELPELARDLVQLPVELGVLVVTDLKRGPITSCIFTSLPLRYTLYSVRYSFNLLGESIGGSSAHQSVATTVGLLRPEHPFSAGSVVPFTLY